MKSWHVLAAALAAGALGIAANLSLDHPGMSRTRAGQALLLRTRAGQDAGSLKAGDMLPDLEVPDLAGRSTRLRPKLAGRPALINVWASWCGPCIEEMPALEAFSRQQGPNGVQVAGIALDEPAAVRDFLRRIPVRYPLYVDTPGPADAGVRLGNPRGVLPYSVLVDARGRVLRQWVGPLRSTDLDRWAAEARTQDGG